MPQRPTWKSDDFPSTSESVHYHGLPSDFSSIVDPEEDHTAPGVVGLMDVPDDPVDIPNVLPPARYELVEPATPGAHLHLLQQHVHIVRVLQRTFLSNERTLILVNGFPSALDRQQIVEKGMLDACTELGYTGLYMRIFTDGAFRKSLIALVRQPPDPNVCRNTNALLAKPTYQYLPQ